MKTKLLIALLFLTLQSIAQPCTLWPRYDQAVFNTLTTTSDIVYGTNNNYQGVNTILKLDVYEPTGDTLAARPLVLLAHGGSFIFGDKTNADQVDLCEAFASRGYVTATINYRLGITFPTSAATATDAVYRAVQDMKAAIRFFKKDAATINQFKIDTNLIFIGGTSAGAFTALHTAYMDTYAELPSTIDTAVLGDLDGNSGNPGYTSNINAVINLCGALGSAQWIVPGDVPLCSMHGTADQTVPYGHQMLYLLGVVPIQVIDGSYAIHDYIRTFNHPAVMYTWPGAPHVPYDGNNATAIAYLDTTVRFVSNFLYSYLGCTPSDTNPSPNTIFTTTAIATADEPEFYVTNPASDQIVISNLMEKGMINIYDLSGRKILTRPVARGTSRLVMPAEGWIKGYYFIHYETDKGVKTGKVLVGG